MRDREVNGRPPDLDRRIEEATLLETDDVLVEQARQGDAVAYAALVERYRAVALRTAQSVLRDTAEAEDAVQEGFIKAFYALSRFKSGKSFRPWICEIVVNQARNQRRAGGRRDALALRASPTPAATGVSPETDVLLRERRQTLVDALNTLRTADRAVIAYRFFVGLSEPEMAQALGIARGTVKSRLSRALERLRPLLTKEILAAIALILLALALLGARQDVRDALAERLGLRGVQITQLPSPVTRVPSTQLGARLSLGQSTTLTAARKSVTFDVVVPAMLGEPDEVYVLSSPPGGQVALVYAARDGIPFANTTGVGVLLTEFQATIQSGGPILKGLPPGSRLEDVTVNGAHGYWIDGDPHVFFFQDTAGHTQSETTRLAANVVLWEHGPLTLRLESALDRDAAVALASSLQ
jgi:RNA polymerase sigma-70 factor (ECF subfamily)